MRWRVRRATIVVAWLIAFLAAFALFSKILPWFTQANLQWIVLFLPIHLALAFVASNSYHPRPTVPSKGKA